jgi:polyisoprenoid-binding protein YceI
MLGSSIRYGPVLAALVLLVAGCASTQTTPLPTAPLVSPPTSAPTSLATPTAAPPTAPSATNSAAGNTPATGATPIQTVTLVVVPEKSQARYRVREQLAGFSLPDDAVGSTNAITGTIVGKTDGTIVSSESKFVVDLRTLKSDQSMRDGFIQRNPLQTAQYPYATFVPTSASGLPTSMPPSLQGSFKLVGDLTIRNETKQVTWDATCQVQSNQTEGTCHATTSFTFEDFNLTQPKVGRVLSIVDKITLEVDLDLQRVGT